MQLLLLRCVSHTAQNVLQAIYVSAACIVCIIHNHFLHWLFLFSGHGNIVVKHAMVCLHVLMSAHG